MERETEVVTRMHTFEILVRSSSVVTVSMYSLMSQLTYALGIIRVLPKVTRQSVQ